MIGLESSKSPWNKMDKSTISCEKHKCENQRTKLCWLRLYSIRDIIHDKCILQSKHQHAAAPSNSWNFYGNMFVERHQIFDQACGFWITVLHLPTSTFGKVIFGQEINISDQISLILTCLCLQFEAFLCSP